MKSFSYEIVLEREEDPLAGYSVYCPSLPGCFSNGGTMAEAKANMQEAISLYVESLLAHGEQIPTPRKTIHVDELTLALPA